METFERRAAAGRCLASPNWRRQTTNERRKWTTRWFRSKEGNCTELLCCCLFATFSSWPETDDRWLFWLNRCTRFGEEKRAARWTPEGAKERERRCRESHPEPRKRPEDEAIESSRSIKRESDRKQGLSTFVSHRLFHWMRLSRFHPTENGAASADAMEMESTFTPKTMCTTVSYC